MATEEKNAMKVGPTGAWIGTDMEEHVFDRGLASGLDRFLVRNFKNEKTGSIQIADFGAGTGSYVSFLRRRGYTVTGIDGNPDTHQISRGSCGVQDLTVPFDLGRKFNCIICLEVGEHIPPELCDQFLDNIRNHASDIVVLSWGIPGQEGLGHVHCLPNESVVKLMAERGFMEMPGKLALREVAERTWFKNSIMVFKKLKGNG